MKTEALVVNGQTRWLPTGLGFFPRPAAAAPTRRQKSKWEVTAGQMNACRGQWRFDREVCKKWQDFSSLAKKKGCRGRVAELVVTVTGDPPPQEEQ